MEKLNHKFYNGEVIEAKPLNEITDKVNDIIDAQGTILDAADEIEDIKEAVNNLPDGQAVTLEVERHNRRLAYLEHLFGEYATPDPQSLLIDPTRKDVAISSESMSEVAAQGWAISQPIVIRKGNIYRIKVGEASGQYVTTAMRYQYRDEAGNLRYAYKRKTQLDEHSELPVDGYLIMYGLPRDYELVVCFKYTADYDPVVEVLTAGLLRTLAFQLGDMQDMIDQKLDVNGHSSAASVGGAMALLQKGDVPEDTYSELLTARMIGNAPDLMHLKGSTDTRSGIDDGKDVNVVVEKVWGDVIGGNQMLPNNLREWSSNGITCTKNEDGSFTLNGTCQGGTAYGSMGTTSPIEGHKYLIIGGDEKFSFESHISIVGLNTQKRYASVSTCGKAHTTQMSFFVPVGAVLDNVKKYVSLFDVTIGFPTDPSFVDSLTSTDAIKVAHRLGFSAFTLD